MPTDEAVIDPSVIVAIVTPEEQTNWAHQKMAEPRYFHVLDLSYYEVANALRYKTTDNLTEDIQVAWSDAKKLLSLFSRHSFSEVIDESLLLAERHKITVNDAAYVVLAKELHSRLLTLDLRLARKLQGTEYYDVVECPAWT